MERGIMQRRTLLVAVAVAARGLATAGPASGQVQNPPGCTTSGLHLDLVQDHSLVRIGDSINYVLKSDNNDPEACQVQGVNIYFQTPGADGTPSGTPELKLPGQTYERGTVIGPLGPYAYTVAVNPGVSVLRARASVANAVLQDGANSPVNINKEISARIFTPSITIEKSGSTRGPLPAPQDVTYTFTVRNGSDTTLNPAATAISNVKVTDDKCGNPTYVSGDDNRNGTLDAVPAEAWKFTCTLTHPAPGTYHNVATASGDNILYNRPVPVVSPPAVWDVV